MNRLLLTHGAGSNHNAPLLVVLAAEFGAKAVEVTRYDLPFRQKRQHGPPRPGDAALDRQGLREQLVALREQRPEQKPGQLWLGGHSYGGRQASILASEEPRLVDALLLLSYPLHPPKKAGQMRTAHFPKLQAPVMFVHGSRDPFGSLDELNTAIALIPTPVQLLEVDGAGHDLGRDRSGLAQRIVSAFLGWAALAHHD